MADLPKPVSAALSQSFSERVFQYSIEKGISCAQLARASNLAKSTVSRMCCNTNHKGKPYTPTLQTVLAVAIGLQLTVEQKDELVKLAFRQNAVVDYALEHHLDMIETNALLYDAKLPLLGIDDE